MYVTIYAYVYCKRNDTKNMRETMKYEVCVCVCVEERERRGKNEKQIRVGTIQANPATTITLDIK